MPNIFDVAKQAGVSITTVSRALNGYSDVNEKTRKRILKIAEELSYYPSAVARSLQGKKTNTIAFAPWLRDHIESRSFFKEIVGVLALGCLKYDLSLLVSGADSSQETSETLREVAGSGRVDGIILSDLKPEDERVALLTDIGIPFVAFGRTANYQELSYPFIDVDGAAGICTMVEYVYNQGRRRLAYLSGPFNTSYSVYRFNGYRESLSKFGIAEDPRLVVADLQEQNQIKQAVNRLFSLPEHQQPEAIIASNDMLALNVINSLTEMGREVGSKPGQTAVTGFDDLPFAAFLRPALTTARQSIEDTCGALLELLVAVMRQDGAEAKISQTNALMLGPKQYLLRPELVIRESA